MFVFKKVYPFTAVVKVAEGVAPEAFEFTAHFEAATQSRLDELHKDNPTAIDAVTAAEVLKGWNSGDLVDENKSPLPITPENIAAIIDLPWMRGPIVKAYYAVINGWQQKN